VSAAEEVAEGSDWRGGHDRLTALLTEWKALPRLDKGADDALWRRFSAARSAFSKRRKQQLASREEQRARAQSTKERLAKEAEALAESTDWVATGRRFRDLMQEWKAAGRPPVRWTTRCGGGSRRRRTRSSPLVTRSTLHPA
jgi:hypothetical protein